MISSIFGTHAINLGTPPNSVRTATFSAQIRDGFMTAYYQIPANSRPRLRVYDSAITSIAVTDATVTFHFRFDGTGPGYACVYEGDFGGTRG